MKDFLKYVGATLVGLFIFGIVVTGLVAMSFASILAATNSETTVEKGSVLVVDLSGDMQERAEEDLRARIAGLSEPGLEETMYAIKKASENDGVSGIYLRCGVLSADMAQLQEIRNALADFKKKGKWIVAYGEIYSQGAYYVASVADKILLNPVGAVTWHGAGGNVMYLKGLLDKVGVKVIPVKVGKYKSATETFTETQMSEANRQQTERYLGGFWQEMCSAVGKSRGITVDSLNTYADRMVEMVDAKQLVKMKMVDRLAYADEAKEVVRKLLKLGEDDGIPQLSVSNMQSVRSESEGEEIVVYYAYGSIEDEVTPGAFAQDHEIVATEMCADLEELAEDDDVKAVVIRVNSPGGSASASEQIWHAGAQLKAKKPVVVSMGGMAASGGYYISAGANHIVAEPTTITGSIGIFGLVPNASELLTNKLGLSFDEVKTNRNVPMLYDGLNAEQMGYLQAYIDRGYLLFKTRVAQGRKLKMDRVEELAQGHVYLGSDAKELGLVDEMGGLDQAVAKAAKLAKLDKYFTSSLPEPASWMALLLQDTDNGNIMASQLRGALGEMYEPLMMICASKRMCGIQARLPFVIMKE